MKINSFSLLVADAPTNVILGILLFVFFILLFAISGAEAALFSLTEKDVNLLKTKQHTPAKRITNLLEEPKEVYATLLIAGTFISICIILLFNYFIDSYISFPKALQWAAILCKGVSIAFLLFFFGRLLPKVYATQDSLRFAFDWSFIIESLHLLLGRISKSIIGLADNIGIRVGANRTEAMNFQELDEAIDIQPDDETSPEEKNIMKGIVKFGNISVKQIVKSRLEVSGIDYNSSFSVVIKKVADLHYSRLPVYKGSLDNVAGILNTKDLIPFVDEKDDFDWRRLLRTPYFVPETKLIEDLLKEFQQKRIHFAIAVDEFGGTSGIVTMEDILEEVIGEIRDEFDEEEAGNQKVDDNTYIFEGKTKLHDICKAMKLPTDTFDLIRGESESLNGLVLEIAEEFPEVNTEQERGGFIFTILDADKNRIKLIKITVNR